MLSASDWGEIGLIQTPTARMAPGGDVRVNVSAGSPYVRINTMFQRFDWLEGGFRYTDINNVLYGPSIAGDQTYKDKSLDVKIRLAQESHFVPELAFGVRDLGAEDLSVIPHFLPLGLDLAGVVARHEFGDPASING